MTSAATLTAKEVAELLGVSVPTVYAYVSRGLLRSLPGPDGTRERRYPRQDVLAFRERQTLHKAPREAVDEALHWGTPLLTSALVQVRDGRLFYREHDAVALSGKASLEQVAALLWTGDLDTPLDAPRVPAILSELSFAKAVGSFVDRYASILPIAAASDPAAWDLRPEGMASTGVHILHLGARLAGARSAGGIAGGLARGLGVPEGADLLSRALVLAAEHELNVSSFTARCVASAGSTPWHAVQAGLAALVGTRHGGQSLQAEVLLAEAFEQGAKTAIGARLRRGETVPGFGHPLYPDGDPRGEALLEAAARYDRRQGKLLRDLRSAGSDLLGSHPTLDLGLAATARVLGLPKGTSLTLFALARTVGWIGHAIEQVASGKMIRPRARYAGP